MTTEVDPRFNERRPPADCVIGLDFDKNDGSSFLSKHNGTLNNGATITNGYLSLAGVDDVLTLDYSEELGLSNVFSVSMWINPTTTPTTGRTLIGRRAIDTHNYRSYIILYSTTSIECLVSSNSITDMSYTFSGTFPGSDWIHFGAYYNGNLTNTNRWKIFINGVSYSSTSRANDANLTPYNYTAIGTSIGINGWPAPAIGLYLPWVGYMDKIIVLNKRALTEQEFKDIYNQGRT